MVAVDTAVAEAAVAAVALTAPVRNRNPHRGIELKPRNTRSIREDSGPSWAAFFSFNFVCFVVQLLFHSARTVFVSPNFTMTGPSRPDSSNASSFVQ